MKVVYCIHSLSNRRGIEREVSFKSSWLADNAGFEVYVVTAHQHGRPLAFPLSPSVHLADVGLSDNFPPFYPLYSLRLRRILRDIRPDVVVSVAGGEMRAVSGCGLDCRKIVEYRFAHGKFFCKYRFRPYAALRTRILERQVSRFDRLVVLTRADVPEWSHLKMPVCQIYNCIVDPCNAPSPLEDKTIVAVGGLERQKNYGDLLDAWLIVHDAHPDWTLDIYGGGSLGRSLDKRIRRDFPGGEVRLRGVTRDVPGVYCRASAIALTSLYEGFPNVLVGASACGLPIVSYDCPEGPSEIVEDGVNGFLVQMGDVRALAERLCRIIENPALRQEMGRRSLELAARFDTGAIMRRWTDFFQNNSQ